MSRTLLILAALGLSLGLGSSACDRAAAAAPESDAKPAAPTDKAPQPKPGIKAPDTTPEPPKTDASGDKKPEPGGPAAKKPAKVDPEEAIFVVPDNPPPSGTFTGGMSGDVSGDMRIVVREGVLTDAMAEPLLKRRFVMPLEARAAADSRTIALMARSGRSYLQLTGRFLDDERAEGTYKGNLGKKRVTGRWYTLRR